MLISDLVDSIKECLDRFEQSIELQGIRPNASEWRTSVQFRPSLFNQNRVKTLTCDTSSLQVYYKKQMANIINRMRLTGDKLVNLCLIDVSQYADSNLAETARFLLVITILDEAILQNSACICALSLEIKNCKPEVYDYYLRFIRTAISTNKTFHNMLELLHSVFIIQMITNKNNEGVMFFNNKELQNLQDTYLPSEDIAEIIGDITQPFVEFIKDLDASNIVEKFAEFFELIQLYGKYNKELLFDPDEMHHAPGDTAITAVREESYLIGKCT